MSVLGPLQAAIYAKLTGTGGLSQPVYDNVPVGAVLPYVTIGEDTSIDWGSKTEDGEEVTITLHAWSSYRGKKEAKEIMAAIYALLHRQPLTVTGFMVVWIRHDFSTVQLDPDGQTYHGIIRFRALIQAS